MGNDVPRGMNAAMTWPHSYPHAQPPPSSPAGQNLNYMQQQQRPPHVCLFSMFSRPAVMYTGKPIDANNNNNNNKPTFVTNAVVRSVSPATAAPDAHRHHPRTTSRHSRRRSHSRRDANSDDAAGEQRRRHHHHRRHRHCGHADAGASKTAENMQRNNTVTQANDTTINSTSVGGKEREVNVDELRGRHSRGGRSSSRRKRSSAHHSRRRRSNVVSPEAKTARDMILRDGERSKGHMCSDDPLRMERSKRRTRKQYFSSSSSSRTATLTTSTIQSSIPRGAELAGEGQQMCPGSPPIIPAPSLQLCPELKGILMQPQLPKANDNKAMGEISKHVQERRHHREDTARRKTHHNASSSPQNTPREERRRRRGHRHRATPP